MSEGDLNQLLGGNCCLHLFSLIQLGDTPSQTLPLEGEGRVGVRSEV